MNVNSGNSTTFAPENNERRSPSEAIRNKEKRKDLREEKVFRMISG